MKITEEIERIRKALDSIEKEVPRLAAETLAVRVPCGYCDAEVGEPCVVRFGAVHEVGAPMPHFHVRRTDEVLRRVDRA